MPSKRRMRRSRSRLAERRDGGRARGDGFFSLQFHPEAAPGPLDAFPSSTGSPTHAEAHRPSQHPDHRLGADPDRPGLRVRLLRVAGVSGAALGGVPRRARQLEPGDDHDRPCLGRCDLYRAARRRCSGAIIARERPDALLPTLGGQTALNLAVELAEAGVLERFGVELIGADIEAIRGGGQAAFRDAMVAAGLAVPESVVVARWRSFRRLRAGGRTARVHARGRGGGLARTEDELARGSSAASRSARSAGARRALRRGLAGVRARGDGRQRGNCVVVCSIENMDPMGVHTGDSWTVAPQQTLPDGEYQRLREAAFTCARTVGVATGGANVQFAYDPASPRPRVDRDEPARLAVVRPCVEGHGVPDREARGVAGGRATRSTSFRTTSRAGRAPRSSPRSTTSPSRRRGSISPSSRGSTRCSGTEMRAVGEALGLGRTFPEAFLKALEGREALTTMPEIPGLHRTSRPSSTRSAWPSERLSERRRRGASVSGFRTRGVAACSGRGG